MESIKLINGDCLEVMKTLPNNSIDFCLTDPPYGTTGCKWDSVIPFEPMWNQLKRIVKDNGAIALFGSEPFSSFLRMSNIKMFKYDWIWYKSNPSNIALANKHPMKYHEIISVFYKKCKYYKQMIPRESNVLSECRPDYVLKNKTSEQTTLKEYKKRVADYDKDFKNPSSVIKVSSLRPISKEFVKHPTQKPIALLEYLIKTYTLENETVLDFTMGSGSTGVACFNLNRNFIGIEKELKYFNIAKERLNG